MSTVAKRTYRRRKPVAKPSVRRAAPRRTYRRRAVRGRGAYEWAPAVLGAVGNALVPGVGGAIGTALGGAISGKGLYKVKHNVLMESNDPPIVVNKSGKHGVTFRHREYLRDILSSGIDVNGGVGTPSSQFNLSALPINPGQVITFPWFASVASNFEEYSIEGMIFEYRSMSGDAITGTNTSLGSVIMAVQYNVTNPLFGSKTEMENYEFASSCRPSSNMICPVECSKFQTPMNELYVRFGNQSANTDLRLYDLGIFEIATVGCQGLSTNLGELWCSYQICCYKPKLFSGLGYSNLFTHLYANDYTNAFPFGVATYSPVLPTPISNYVTYDNIGFYNYNSVNGAPRKPFPAPGRSNIAVDVVTSTIAFAPSGFNIKWKITMIWSSNGAGACVYGLNNLVFVNCTAQQDSFGDAISEVAAPQQTLAGTETAMLTFVISNTNAGLFYSVQLPGGAGTVVPGGAGGQKLFDLLIEQVPFDFN
uniref:Capsid protein n=1 Tax=Cruciviridae sp. TaxID=1955495 RepID=A0A1S6LVJ5_9VIRU|nr:capsid protein [Cruciviridae sp.]